MNVNQVIRLQWKCFKVFLQGLYCGILDLGIRSIQNLSILFTVRQKFKLTHSIKDMTRARKRKGRVLARNINGIQQQPWKQPRNPYSPFEIVSADQIEEIHRASLRILRELGVAFLDDDDEISNFRDLKFWVSYFEKAVHYIVIFNL